MGSFVRVSNVLESADGKLFFQCPGCNMLHGVNVERSGIPKWQFDGNVDAPTFSPSVLVTYDWGPNHMQMRCHSFVRGGKIQFLQDCSHELAGQTIDMVPIDDDDE